MAWPLFLSTNCHNPTGCWGSGLSSDAVGMMWGDAAGSNPTAESSPRLIRGGG